MENFKLSYKGIKPQKERKIAKCTLVLKKNMLLFKTQKNPKNILKIQKPKKTITFFISST